MYIEKILHIYICNVDHVFFNSVTGSCKQFTDPYEEV